MKHKKSKEEWAVELMRKIPVPPPATLNWVSQCCFVIGLSGIAGCGVCMAIPFLYSDYPWIQWLLQGFGTFLAFQLLVNWLCIRFVDTSYSPFKYGAVPDSLKIGQNINKQDGVTKHQNGQASKRNICPSSTVAVDRNLPTSNENLMYVATAFPEPGSNVPKRTAFPYWSWAPCLLCNRPRPPRCHHCPLCNKCILKRDHHCFFAGACVGYQNLRHFTVFLFWATVATIFAILHYLPFYYITLYPYMRVVDLITPVALVRALLGCVEFKIVFLTFLGWLCLFFFYWACSFLVDVSSLISRGITSFEVSCKLKIYDRRNVEGKLQSVFGRYWLLNFLVPLHFIYPPIDDPIHWPDHTT